MKDKLILKLKQFIIDMKESAGTFVIDISPENKESIFGDLFIPFMQLTNSESVADLTSKLSMLVDSENNSNEATELLGNIIDVMIQDVDNSSIEEELKNLVTNAYAVLNKINELKSNNESTAITTLNDEILAFMNINIVAPDTAQNEAVDPAAAPTTDPVTPPAATDPATDPATNSTSAMSIINAVDEVDETPQADVNKIEIKNILETAITDKVEGTEAAIDEMFALVKSYDKKADWQQPHHVIKDSNVILNTNGLQTAALFLLKPTSTKNLTSEDKSVIAKHLLRHYNEIKMDAPAKLTNMSENKESIIMLNIQEDEMKEFGQIFDIGVEDVQVYLGLMESLLTDFVNSGILNIDKSDNNTSDESVISVKLNKQQTQELIEYFDIMSNDITHILNSDFGSLSYKKTDTDLNNSYKESQTQIDNLNTMVEELELAIQERNEEISNMSKFSHDIKLDQAKFEAIINFVKSIENVDDTVIQFVNNVVDADNARDVGYLVKLGSTFMKNTNTPTRFKKVSMLNHATSHDLKTLNTLLEGTDEYDDTNPSVTNEVSKRVSDIADLF